MSIIIHGSILSPFVRKVSLVAAEKNIAIERQDLNPFAPPANFEEISPLRRIPVLEEDGFFLADSSAIVAYLDAKQPSPALLSSEPKARGQALWIEEYADTALASDIGLGVFRPALIKPMMGKPVDLEAIKEALTVTLPPRFAYLEAQIDGKEWFAGSELGVADIAVYSQITSLLHTGHLPEAELYPSLMAHFAKIQARPTSQELLQTEIAVISAVKEKIQGSK
ncbi:glutathione S-transferase family protein [Arenicella xantha]|uniref:Glutathione S-transferase n=1 Tax=Arenicella xantha TaxID=644221 RepID=A0A395JLW9_9GAMM|nr:glutathione S-transferase family protein [Arenicella xantha]RBP50604.1 glutathione S-transferase [Arenicella xantha]